LVHNKEWKLLISEGDHELSNSSSISKETNNRHWYVVATVCIGAFMAALDASIINIALPTLEHQFHAKMNEIEWVSLSYLLSLAALILIFGRIADMIGRRFLYLIGFSLFSISSLFCGLSPSLSVLIISRVFQGIGAAMLQANSVAIVTFATPKKDLGKAIGIQASAQGIGLSLGPVAGGALLTFLSWRWLFLINVPVGVVGTVLGLLFLPKDAVKVVEKKFDYIGAVFLIPFLITIIFTLNMGLKLGWGSPIIVGCYMIAITTFLSFLQIERKRQEPLVDLSLFKNIHFTMANVTSIMSFIVMYAVLLLTPYYLEHAKHLPVFHASLLITFVPIGMTIATPLSGMMSDLKGHALPELLGLIMATVGTFLLAIIDITGTYILTCSGLFLVGAGIGMFTPPNNSSVMGNVSKEILGIAGGILNMSRTLGMGLGVTLGGLTYQFFLQTLHQSNPDFMFRMSYLVIALFSTLTLFTAFKNIKEVFRR
jgi:EmrB/QacA subfamily drug resistance transporter